MFVFTVVHRKNLDCPVIHHIVIIKIIAKDNVSKQRIARRTTNGRIHHLLPPRTLETIDQTK